MDASPPTVAITGAAGYIGTRLLQELENQGEVRKVLAMDTKPLSSSSQNVVYDSTNVIGLEDTAFRDHGVTTVVHLAFNFGPGRNPNEVDRIRRANLGGVDSVLNACRGSNVTNLIYLSSHSVYGASADNPIPITELAPVRPTATFQYAYNKGLCEAQVREFAQDNPEVNVAILRCCMVMGRGTDNRVPKAFFKPVMVGVKGYDPPLQFVHEDDLARLLHMLIMTPHPGIFNVAGDGVINYTDVVRAARRRLIMVPSVVVYPLVQLAWTLGVQKEAPAVGLDFVRYPVVVSTAKLKKETGFRFLHSSEEALLAYLLGKRFMMSSQSRL